MMRKRRLVALSILLALSLALSLAPGSFAQSGRPGFGDPIAGIAKQFKDGRVPQVSPEAMANMQVIATGLNNPRHLTIGPDGGVYVAEAGAGGTSCYPDPRDPASVVCVGTTGSITRIEDGVQTRIATGLPSLADPSGVAAEGPFDISWRPRDAFSVLVGGLGMLTLYHDQLAALNPLFDDMGKLARMNPAGSWSYMADVFEYERVANPDGGAIDSNPYAVFSAPGRKRIVADAGGNALLEVNNGGQIKTLAVFPNLIVPYPPMFGGGEGPAQAVPTTVTQGPDGAYYIGQLSGFPFAQGAANVYRLVPRGQPQVVASGFSSIIDIDFGADGSLYVLEIAADLFACEILGGPCEGRLTRIAPDGTRTVLASQLPFPTGIAIGSNGEIYMSLFGIFPGMGMVVRM